MKGKRHIVLLLIFCFIISTVIACSKTEIPEQTTTPQEETTPSDDSSDDVSEQPEEAEEDQTDEDPFPGADLGGVTLKVWGFPNPETVDEAEKEKWSERLKAVEEKFNCKLDFSGLEGVGWNDVPQTIISSVAAGDPVIDFGDMSRYYISSLVTNDAILDMTEVVKNYNLPKAYWEGGCQWGDKIIGFSRGPMLPWSSLVYRRDIIQEVGMEKTPGEMFVEGKWSLDDFYSYCKELQSRLPEGTYVLGIHALNWARGAAFANGAYMMDAKTYHPGYLSDGFIEIVEFFQKLVQEGIAVNATEVTRDDGTTGYDWNPAQQGFDEGKIVITHGDNWNFDGWAAQFDFGVVPFPWGSNVTLEDPNDYRTLSDNYTNYYKDNGVFVVVKGGEKKATPEQYMNLLFSYWTEMAELLQENREREAKGEPITWEGKGAYRWFSTDLDAELWDWYIGRYKFDPLDTTTQSSVFFRALYKVCSVGGSPRAEFEAIVGEDIFAMIEAGLIKEEELPDDLKQKVAEFREKQE
ncbi:MAG: extracellular solute-binding protein [Clostridiales bacterium]|jgi:hypothetical protein|nr:extracellular solute-binding protein [Clostridiales bacterium]